MAYLYVVVGASAPRGQAGTCRRRGQRCSHRGEGEGVKGSDYSTLVRSAAYYIRDSRLRLGLGSLDLLIHVIARTLSKFGCSEIRFAAAESGGAHSVGAPTPTPQRFSFPRINSRVTLRPPLRTLDFGMPLEYIHLINSRDSQSYYSENLVAEPGKWEK